MAHHWSTSRVANAETAFHLIPHVHLSCLLLAPHCTFFKDLLDQPFRGLNQIMLLSCLKSSSNFTLHLEESQTPNHSLKSPQYLSLPTSLTWLSVLHLVHYSRHTGLLTILEVCQAHFLLRPSSHCSLCREHSSELVFRMTHAWLPYSNVTSPEIFSLFTLLVSSYTLSHYCLCDGKTARDSLRS